MYVCMYVCICVNCVYVYVLILCMCCFFVYIYIYTLTYMSLIVVSNENYQLILYQLTCQLYYIYIYHTAISFCPAVGIHLASDGDMCVCVLCRYML